MLLPCRAHRRELRWDITLDDPVSMGNPDRGAFTGGDVRQLLRGGSERGFGLPCRICFQRMQRDMAHLVVQAGETAELVEHAVAPQEVVRGGGQLVAIGAELQIFGRAMIAQILRHDAVLHHAAEGDAGAAGRPGQLPRQRKIRRQQYRGAGNDGQAALQ